MCCGAGDGIWERESELLICGWNGGYSWKKLWVKGCEARYCDCL